MTFRELLTIVDQAYPGDVKPGDFYVVDDERFDGGFVNEFTDHGDTLALFICRELHDTFDVDASRDDQLNEAYRVMGLTVKEMEAVRLGLYCALENKGVS